MKCEHRNSTATCIEVISKDTGIIKWECCGGEEKYTQPKQPITNFTSKLK